MWLQRVEYLPSASYAPRSRPMRGLLSALQQAIEEGHGVRDLPTSSRLVVEPRQSLLRGNALVGTGGTYACAQSATLSRILPKTCRAPSRSGMLA